MSNPAYQAKVRRVTSAGPQGSPAPAIDPVVEDFEEVEEIDDPYEAVEVAPTHTAGSRGRTLALGAALVLLLSVFGAAIWLLSTNTKQDTTSLAVGLNVGNIAPNFELVDVRTNQPVQLASLRGRPVLVNFWGTWCPPCRQEMPAMQGIYNKYKDDMVMVGVSMGPRDSPELVKGFVDQANYTWTFIHDANSNIAQHYQAYSIPSSYFIDKDGVIQARHVGAMNSEMMEEYLSRTKGQAR